MKQHKKNALPYFSYVGGKRWLKNDLNNILNISLHKNKKIDTYVEPFMGGLGAFFSNYEILKKNEIKNVILNDINVSVYSLFTFIRERPNDFLELYLLLENDFKKSIPSNFLSLDKKISLLNARDVYFEKRSKFNEIKNQHSLENAAYFLFLQNHCFNGFYRENKKGDYNTAFNWENSNSIYNKDKIKKINDIFSLFNLKFKNEDFSLINMSDNHIIYADPPYINEIEGTETNYNKNSFGINDISILVDKMKKSNYIFSHYKNEKVLNLFKDHNHDMIFIDRKNKVSGKKETRNDIKTEVLIFS